MSSVLILGGGITGVTAATCLARHGVEVHLVERSARLGGHAVRFGCKATNVCLRCNVCVAHAAFRAVRTFPNLHVHLQSRLEEVQMFKGGRKLRVKVVPNTNRHADSAATAAPSTAPAQVPQHLDVDAVIVATGFAAFDPRESSVYGYGRVMNVITGLEAEEQLARQQVITRPSDGQIPKKIACIQCVGSRTEEVFRRPEDTNYCSTVCCAYALRMARHVFHAAPNSAVTVFYMDIQHFGQDFDSFWRDCRQQIRFVRSRPSEIFQGPNDTVLVRYAAEATPDKLTGVSEESFDLAVLAVGLRPAADARTVADHLGLFTDPCGFFGNKAETAFADTGCDRIFVAGACEAPKDIASCIAQAEAVAARVLTTL